MHYHEYKKKLEEDDKAGGEGLGRLATTRKPLWRDTDGNILNARSDALKAGSGSNPQSSLSLPQISEPSADSFNDHNSDTSELDAPFEEYEEHEVIAGYHLGVMYNLTSAGHSYDMANVTAPD